MTPTEHPPARPTNYVEIHALNMELARLWSAAVQAEKVARALDTTAAWQAAVDAWKTHNRLAKLKDPTSENPQSPT